MKVLIAGGSGLIGSALYDHLSAKGYEVITIDLKGMCDYRLDIRDILELRKILPQTTFTWINCTYPKENIKHIEAYLDSSYCVAESMKFNGGGHMINFSSIYGVVGGRQDLYTGTNVTAPHLGYCAAKGAIISLTRAIATWYGRYGIRANCISPGGVYDNQDAAFVTAYSHLTPLCRMADPIDIAEAVRGLVEMKYVTGVNLLVDGGLTAW